MLCETQSLKFTNEFYHSFISINNMYGYAVCKRNLDCLKKEMYSRNQLFKIIDITENNINRHSTKYKKNNKIVILEARI